MAEKQATITEKNPGPLWKEKLKDTQRTVEHPMDTPANPPPKKVNK